MLVGKVPGLAGLAGGWAARKNGVPASETAKKNVGISGIAVELGTADWP